MDPMTIILFYNGTWVDKTTYNDYEVAGILIPIKCSYNVLAQEIYETLSIDRNKYGITVKFQIKEGIPPITIKDDNGCKFYHQIRKKNDDETRYPLMVNTFESSASPECLASNNYLEIGETSMQCTEQLPTRTEYAQLVADYAYDHAQQALQTSSEINHVITNPQIDRIHVGQVFSNKQTLKNAISLYSIRQNRPFKVKRSSTLDYKIFCVDENYITSGNHPQATSNLVGHVIKNKFVNPKRNYTPNEIVDDIADDYSVSISYQKARRAREKAMVDARRCPQESYGEIPSILYMMQISNPGTITRSCCDEDGKFKYLYFAIGASIKGWQHCTPIIVTDGTFLTNQYGGTLLTANAQNANRHIFPLAFAIVDSENDNSWNWFMQKIKETYGEREGQCIISDRHESIYKATKSNFPLLMHGVCCYHLLKNLKMKFKKGGDELKHAFDGASKAYTIEEFEKCMQDLDNIDLRIRDFLANEVGYDKWTRLYSMNKRYKTMTSNIAESVNAALKSVRELPVATLLECLHSLVQRWYWENKNRALKTDTTLANIPEKALKKQREMGLKYKKFDYDEMPCSHAMAVLAKRNFSCYKYCSYYYTKEAFMSTYEDSILPLGEATSWNIPEDVKNITVHPPKYKRPAGRPKKDRYKGAMDTKTKVKCGKCNQKGHNRRSCKNEAILNPLKRRKLL
ncbi:uncharacterized protein LOC115713133 [Cannabis sativa]|uniref:uncharacterized protein LOC115713133 n=1 Tax=Cannabis sativa TaxID=3483 RepID=UPI0029C9C67E|nr:uncharacterized protein LOC115713133 [Cannabis sativa]